MIVKYFGILKYCDKDYRFYFIVWKVEKLRYEEIK